MKLSKEQTDLLASLSTSYKTGSIQTSLNGNTNEDDLNIIPKPINCPNWACILLPCISHIPSMKTFKRIQPQEAEVRRGDKWVIYDATSIVKGDIVRLSDGDIVPADAVLLSLGMDHVSEGSDNESVGDDSSFVEELVVDASNVTGYTKPQTVRVGEDGTVHAIRLYAGSMILQGTCIVVVSKIGSATLLASMIREGKWPPSVNSLEATSLVEESEVI